jgi:hypothetical protein
MTKRARRRKTPRTTPVRWSCTQHQTPTGQDCQWCRAQGVLFPRADATGRTNK